MYFQVVKNSVGPDHLDSQNRIHPRDFPGLIWGRISDPSQFKNQQIRPKMLYIIPNFLVLHFGENVMKIGTKIAQLQIHENLHKNVNENMFSFTFLCKF